MAHLRCSECPASSGNKLYTPEDYEIHLSVAHFDLSIYECSICSHSHFPTELTLIEHYSKIHKKTDDIRVTYTLTSDRIRKRRKIKDLLAKSSFSVKKEMLEEPSPFSAPSPMVSVARPEPPVFDLSDDGEEEEQEESDPCPNPSPEIRRNSVKAERLTGSDVRTAESGQMHNEQTPENSSGNRASVSRRMKMEIAQAHPQLARGHQQQADTTWTSEAALGSPMPVLSQNPTTANAASSTAHSRIMGLIENFPQYQPPSPAQSNTTNRVIVVDNNTEEDLVMEEAQQQPPQQAEGMGAWLSGLMHAEHNPTSTRRLPYHMPVNLNGSIASTTNGAGDNSALADGMAMPKKPKTPYQHFCAQSQAVIKAQVKEFKKRGASYTFSNVARNMWNNTPDKMPWTRLATEDRDRYQKEIAEWDAHMQ